jgi:hypothetical protein
MAALEDNVAERPGKTSTVLGAKYPWHSITSSLEISMMFAKIDLF